MRIHLRHVRSIPIAGQPGGYCVSGSRVFASRHGLSMRDLALDGVDADALVATGDAMALKMVDYVRSLREPG